MFDSHQPAPLLVVVGIAFLAGAAVLAWFAAPATMTIERGADGLRATVERRLFGLVPAGTESVVGIRRIESVSGRLDSRSQTPDQLVFVTDGGTVRPGYDAQRFLRDVPDLREFAEASAPATFVRSTTHRGSEAVRFAVAHAAVLLLATFGLVLVRIAWRKVLGHSGAGIGPA